VVSPGYFAVMRIPLLAGELCRDEPEHYTMMVNRRFADTYWGGAGAIGRHLQGSLGGVSAEIRGIVGDARESGLEHEVTPTVYWCGATAQPGMNFLEIG